MMLNEIREMMAFRRGQRPNEQVRQEVDEQLQNFAAEARHVQQRLQEGGNGEVRALLDSAEQFAAFDPRAAAAQLQEELRQSNLRMEAQEAELSDELAIREAKNDGLEKSQATLKAQVVALKIKLAKTPAVHPAAAVIFAVGDRACTHMINPHIGRITDAPHSRIPTGKT